MGICETNVLFERLKSIKKLKNVEFDEDISYELVEVLEKEKKPCYQELFLEEIVKIMD